MLGLRRFTASVRQVDSGQEYAVSFDGFHGFESGDLIEVAALGHRQAVFSRLARR
jgi:hypothetical protein